MKEFPLNILAVLLIAGFATGCQHSPKAVKPHSYFQTPFQDESQYIVETIVSDLTRQIYYSKFQRLPKAKYFSVSATEDSHSSCSRPRYQLQINFGWRHQATTELNINGPIWSPEVYKGIATLLAQKVGLKRTVIDESEDTDLLAKLLDGTATTLEKQNQILSKSLANDFGDPVWHEEAAVLLGAFALREHSGIFYEISSPLCGMTAQLTMAQYLSNNSLGINGQVATAMLLTLMNNQVEALDALNNIQTTNNDALTRWVRALQARNTGDYRPLEKVNGLSQVEAIEWFRARCLNANKDIAWARLNDVQERTVDFVRIANEGRFSVSLGHELLRLSLPLELDEIEWAYQLSHHHKLNRTGLTGALNQMPELCFSTDGNKQPRVQIIGWGQWAMFFQRQLCNAIVQNFYFLEHAWGVPEYATEFSSYCDRSFGGLYLYSFARRFDCTDVDSYHRAVDDVFKTTIQMPQLVSDECWNYLRYTTPIAPFYEPNHDPHIGAWHKHNPLPGTAYNSHPRADLLISIGGPGLDASIERLHELAPYDENIDDAILREKYHDKPTYKEALALFQAVLPYSCEAMETVARTVQDQPERYESLMNQAAELDPADYFTLGDYFKNRKENDKAAKYFAKACELDPDKVQVANGANWLVQYYLKKGEINSARRLADLAGEVYSYTGLLTKARFLEDTGDYAGAFEWFWKIQERYNDPGPVVAFCRRYKAKTGNTQFDEELQKRLGNLFPDGIKKVTIDDFHSAPRDGVLIDGEDGLTRAAGLASGDVIVALDGIRVHNFAQYGFEREIHSAPEMDLIVWQDTYYREVKASPPNHRFGVNFSDYVAR